MPGGRPAKPTNLKVLHGDRKDRVNTVEPVPSTTEIMPPWKLSKAAQEVWDRLAPDRVRAGVLTAWDTDAFAVFCEVLVLTRAKISSARRRPEVGGASPMSELKTAVSIVSTLGSRFGWTPADRAKLTTGEERRDPTEDLLSG